MTVRTRILDASDGPSLGSLRREALSTDPSAFWSEVFGRSLEEIQGFTEAHWRRLARETQDRFIVGAHKTGPNGTGAELIGMAAVLRWRKDRPRKIFAGSSKKSWGSVPRPSYQKFHPAKKFYIPAKKVALFTSGYVKREFRRGHLFIRLNRERILHTLRRGYDLAIFYIRGGNIGSLITHRRTGAHFTVCHPTRWADGEIHKALWHKLEPRRPKCPKLNTPRRRAPAHPSRI